MKRKNLESWLIKNGFKKDSSYECSFAEKVFYDYYKKESNDVTFLKIIDDYDSVYFGYNRHSIDCEQITESMLENMVKEYDNHKEPTFKVRKFF